MINEEEPGRIAPFYRPIDFMFRSANELHAMGSEFYRQLTGSVVQFGYSGTRDAFSEYLQHFLDISSISSKQ